jgi:hypothetical protein
MSAIMFESRHAHQKGIVSMIGVPIGLSFLHHSPELARNPALKRCRRELEKRATCRDDREILFVPRMNLRSLSGGWAGSASRWRW